MGTGFAGALGQGSKTYYSHRRLIYDYKNHRFGTSEISVFYRVLPTKKGSPEPEKPFLVAGVGFEPTTFWL